MATRIVRVSAGGFLDSAVNSGAVAGGSALDVGAAGVLNRRGNVSEWVADGFASYADDRFDAPRDPFCSPGNGPRAARGGSWRSAPAEDEVAVRRYEEDVANPSVGFRRGR